MNNIITTNQLSKCFKQSCVVDRVDMKVEENKVYGLLGPNGSGKSTLLKLLTGVLSPTKGMINFMGEPIETSHMQYMGSLIEEPAIYSNLTAYENLEILALLLRQPSSRINEVLKIVGLNSVKNKIVKQFSVGMKQRLGIAMAIFNQPKLLILDEPTNGLDPIGIKALRQLIRNFTKEGMTVIVSSHLLYEIQHVADRVGILVDGELRYEAENNKE